MPEAIYAGGCSCGAVRYSVDAPLGKLCWCHCTSCRRASGAAAVPWGTCATSAFRVTRGALALYRSSERVRRGFCAACGTSLTYQHEDRPAEIDITLATLADAAEVAPESHVWVEDKLPWEMIGDGLPQYPRGFP